MTNAKNTLAVASIVARYSPTLRGGGAGGITRTVAVVAVVFDAST
jgi:hypothetical protein